MAVKIFDFAEALVGMDDSRMNMAINAEIAKIRADLKDRPLEKRPRRLKIQLDFKPDVDDETMDLEGATMVFQATSVLPTKVKEGYKLGSRSNGSLVYSTEDAESHCDRPLTD